LTTAVAAVAGVPGPRCVLLACATLTGQASVGWTNDDIDADRDRAAGRADKPVAAGTVSRGLVRACAAGALTATVPLSLLVGWRAGAAHLAAVGWGWMYDVRLKETSASALPYVVSFGLLPVAVAAALPGSPHPQPTVVGAAALLGVAAHFANTVGDADDDAATGVRGLPQRVGPRRSLVVAAGTLLAAAVLLAAATGGSPLTDVAATVTALGFGVTAMAGRGRRTPFLAVLVAAGFLVLAFLATGADHLTR
jgi:4-hydroxybenzoate polyprenyltransferase